MRFRQIQLIPKVLNLLKQCQCTLILIAPQWPRQHWYTLLLDLLIAIPRKLPCSQDLLTPSTSGTLHLTAWLLSTEISQQRVVLRELENNSQNPGEKGHKKIIKANLDNSLAGVVKGNLIPILPL